MRGEEEGRSMEHSQWNEPCGTSIMEHQEQNRAWNGTGKRAFNSGLRHGTQRAFSLSRALTMSHKNVPVTKSYISGISAGHIVLGVPLHRGSETVRLTCARLSEQ